MSKWMTILMNKTRTINIAKDFSEVPAGRFYSDGEVSGQAFREKVLAPALAKPGPLLIDLDGVEGFGSSFLEEAFGGFLRHHSVTLSEFLDRVTFKSDEDPTYIEEIRGYLEDEARKHKK